MCGLAMMSFLRSLCLNQSYSFVLRFVLDIKAREGGPGVKKTSLAYIKVQPVIELLLLQNRKIFVYDENMACQTLGCCSFPYKI